MKQFDMLQYSPGKVLQPQSKAQKSSTLFAESNIQKFKVTSETVKMLCLGKFSRVFRSCKDIITGGRCHYLIGELTIDFIEVVDLNVASLTVNYYLVFDNLAGKSV